MFGQRFARWVRLGAQDTRMLVAITAAAGLAGVYNAPLAGTFFAVEILLADVTLETGHARVRLFGARLMGGEPGQGHAHVLFDLARRTACLPPTAWCSR